MGLQPPDYDLYTGLSLRLYFLLFVLLYVLQTVAVFITKYIVVVEFRKINVIKQFAHSLENCGIVIPLQDWDVDHGTVEEHRERFSKVNREVIVTMVVNFFFNFLMLVPLIYTGNKIFERHDLLGETIGQRSEERVSYENVQLLLMLVLPFFLITSILEPVVFLVYQYKFHPWKDIITNSEPLDFSPDCLNIPGETDQTDEKLETAVVERRSTAETELDLPTESLEMDVLNSDENKTLEDEEIDGLTELTD